MKTIEKLTFMIIFLLALASVAQSEEQHTFQARWNENIGIYYVPIFEPLASDLKVQEGTILVAGVVKGSEAEKAGLKRGDVVLTLTSQVWGSPDKNGQIQISRNGQIIEHDIASKKHTLDDAELADELKPRPTPKKIVVDPTGKGDFRTITAALANASFGDTLLIKDGVYKEGLCLISGITLEGAETKGALLEANVPIQIIGQQITVRRIAQYGHANGPNIWNSKKIEIYDCNISSDANRVFYAGKSTEVLLKGCSLSGNEKTLGVLLLNAQVTIADNIISGNNTAIVLKESSRANITNNLLEANKIGLSAVDSQFSSTKNTITGIGDGTGIVFQNCQATISENFIRRYKFGIDASRAGGEATRNTLTQNEFGAILRSGSFKFSENVILNNRYFGIFLCGDEKAAEALRQATIARNAITGNGSWGIKITNFNSDINYNLIEGNGAGVTVEKASANILNNTVVLQNGPGIQIKPNSQAAIYNNIVAFNKMGLWSDVTSVVKMGFNDVYWNLASKEFPLEDGNYVRADWLTCKSGEKIRILVRPAYDLKADTDFCVDPKFVNLGSDYRMAADSPVAKAKGKDGALIGAFPPYTKTR